MKQYLLVVGIISMLLLVGCANSTKYDAFAQCLTEQGVKMYGAYWCGHCAQQKKLFGDSFEHVNYIECSLPDRSGQTEVCQREGIESYPTWEFADGSRQSGVISLETLSEQTGCQLP